MIKSVRDFEREELCPLSAVTMVREFAAPKIYLSGTQVQERKWQPALGRPATDGELKRIAKSQDWVEVGNERPEKHLKPEKVEYPEFSSEDVRTLCKTPEIQKRAEEIKFARESQP